MTRARVLIAAALLALLFAGLGRLPLIDPDEGRYARTAQEMIQRGDLVVPYFEGLPRLKKPVLFYWLEIGAFTLLGETETAARLPSALAAAGTLLWLYLFARPRLGEDAALRACALLATTPLFFAMARTTTTDMTLTFFVFGATASLYAGLVEPLRPLRHLVVGGLCLGLGLLTKGPVALLFPALGLTAALAARRRPPITIAGRLTAVGWIVVAVAVPWIAVLFHRIGFGEVLEIWRRETLERFEGGLDHPESPLYYLATAPLTFIPWSAFVPFAVVSATRRIKRGEGLLPLLLAWALGAFVFFSMGRGKLDSYLLPLTPAVALLVSIALDGAGRIAGAARWAARMLVLLALALLLPVKLGRSIQDHAEVLLILSLVVASCAVIVATMAWAGKERLVPAALAAVAGAGLLGAALLLPEGMAESRSARDLVRESGLSGSSDRVFAHRVRHPSLDFYLARNASFTPSRNVLLRAVAGDDPSAVVVEESRRDVVLPLLARGFRVVARNGGRIVMRRPARPRSGPGSAS
jgi:4-amino-4-deoxy-L-arabinose transferase-like glycosyltransferase